MPRKVFGHDWELLPPLPKCRDRLNGCLNENGRPKIRWPNAATASWYRQNLAIRSIKPCEPYTCPTCGHWHLGRPKGRYSKARREQSIRRTPRATAGIRTIVEMHRSIVDWGAE